MRRGRPVKESDERDEMELYSIVIHGKGVKQKEAMKEMRMNKATKLEREEKQPDGIKLSPLLLIEMEWNEKRRGLKEMMENKQTSHMLIAGVKNQTGDKTLRV